MPKNKDKKNLTKNISLTGKCLISMPGIEDVRFDRSLIYLCANSKDGTMGIVINRPILPVKFPELLKQLEIKVNPEDILFEPDIVYGGPMENTRGFVIHTADYFLASTVVVHEDVAITATLDILEAIALGKGPAKSMVTLGYASWGPGQLEEEIKNSSWLICDADDNLIFSTPHSQKWKNALKKIGVDANMLSSNQGNA